MKRLVFSLLLGLAAGAAAAQDVDSQGAYVGFAGGNLSCERCEESSFVLVIGYDPGADGGWGGEMLMTYTDASFPDYWLEERGIRGHQVSAADGTYRFIGIAAHYGFEIFPGFLITPAVGVASHSLEEDVHGLQLDQRAEISMMYGATARYAVSNQLALRVGAVKSDPDLAPVSTSTNFTYLGLSYIF